MTNHHLEAMPALEVAELIDQGLASLNARMSDEESLLGEFPEGIPGPSDAEEIMQAVTAACDAWDALADLLPDFR